MKRLLIAALVASTILTACSDGSESVGEYDNPEAKAEMEANLAEAEAEESAEEVDNSERHQFEVGESLAERRKAKEEADAVLAKELDRLASERESSEGTETFVNYHTRMDTVNIDVLNAELYRSGGQSRMSVEFNVENTANEQKKVPLIRSVIVTDGGFQAEGDRQLSVEPEWDLMGATKTSGEIIFDLELEDIDAIESVTLVIPGVDFRSDFEERIEINFHE